MAPVKARLAGNGYPLPKPQRGDAPCSLSPADCFSKRGCRVCACRLRYRYLLRGMRVAAALRCLAASAHTASETDVSGCRVSSIVL